MRMRHTGPAKRSFTSLSKVWGGGVQGGGRKGGRGGGKEGEWGKVIIGTGFDVGICLVWLNGSLRWAKEARPGLRETVAVLL